MATNATTGQAPVREFLRRWALLKGKRRFFLLHVKKNPPNWSDVPTKPSPDQLQCVQACLRQLCHYFGWNRTM